MTICVTKSALAKNVARYHSAFGLSNSQHGIEFFHKFQDTLGSIEHRTQFRLEDQLVEFGR